MHAKSCVCVTPTSSRVSIYFLDRDDSLDINHVNPGACAVLVCSQKETDEPMQGCSLWSLGKKRLEKCLQQTDYIISTVDYLWLLLITTDKDYFLIIKVQLFKKKKCIPLLYIVICKVFVNVQICKITERSILIKVTGVEFRPPPSTLNICTLYSNGNMEHQNVLFKLTLWTVCKI